MHRQNSSTSLIHPRGDLIAHVPRGEEKLLIADIDPTEATGTYAKRYDPQLYREAGGQGPTK